MAADNTKNVQRPGEVDEDAKRAALGNTNEAMGLGYDANGVSRSRDNLMNYAPGGMYASKSTVGASAPRSTSYAQPKAAGYGQSSIQDQIDSLKASQQAAAEASLGKARDSSLSQLGADRAKIDPAYYSARNQASTQNQLGAKNFAEFMASRGQTSSGVANQAEISGNVALQGQMGSLKTSQLGEEAENTRRVQNVNAGYESDLVSSKAGIEAQALQQVINQQNLDRTYNQQNDQFKVTSGLQQQQITNQASQFAQSFGLSEKELANTITQQGVQNAYQDKSFAQAADQFAQQMGLSRDQYASGLDQWAKTFDQSNTQFNVTSGQNQQQINNQASQFAASLAASKASAAASAARANAPKAPTATQIKQSNSADAYADVDRAFEQGTPLSTVLLNISSNGSGYASVGLNPNTYMDYARDKYTASQDAYTANGPTYAEREANSRANSAFTNW